MRYGCRVAPSEGEDQFQADPSEPHDSLLSLHYTKVERPNEDDNMDVVLMTQALHMQILPSFVQAAVGLATCCTHALKANKAPRKQQHVIFCSLLLCSSGAALAEAPMSHCVRVLTKSVCGLPQRKPSGCVDVVHPLCDSLKTKLWTGVHRCTVLIAATPSA